MTRVEIVGRYPDFMTEGSPPCSQVDPEMYFPEKGGSGATQYEFKVAKKICNDCPYRAACLSWAIENNELGVWGGTTERERRVLRRQRRRSA